MQGSWNVLLQDALFRNNSLIAILEAASEGIALKRLERFFLEKPPSKEEKEPVEEAICGVRKAALQAGLEYSPDRLGELLAIVTRRRFVSCMSILITNGTSVLGAKIPGDEHYDSLLHDAVENRCVESVRLLLDQKVPVNWLDHAGWNRPLGLAALAERTDIMKLLLEAGATMNITVSFRFYPEWPWTYHEIQRSFAAACHDGGNMMRFLIDQRDYFSPAIRLLSGVDHPFVDAIRSDNFDVVQLMLDRRVLPRNVQDVAENLVGGCSEEMMAFLQKKGICRAWLMRARSLKVWTKTKSSEWAYGAADFLGRHLQGNRSNAPPSA